MKLRKRLKRLVKRNKLTQIPLKIRTRELLKRAKNAEGYTTYDAMLNAWIDERLAR